MSKCEVVISGIGLITPLGNDCFTTWQNVVAGKSGTGLIAERFNNLENYPCKVAGFVKNEQYL